jgi:hypothetical protein
LIDSQAGALNDLACQQYAEIEDKFSESITYQNTLSTSTCMPAGTCLQRESKDDIQGAFRHFLLCAMSLKDGIPQKGQ